ncbi:hypothetical protein BA895_13415 [Humibacillus sp. DSM 29435]|nr:hypothetical protein BA895_13415 [Humibacillus sp. DSM 29435]
MIDSAAVALREQYIFADVGRRAAVALEDLRGGDLRTESIDDLEEVCQTLTDVMHEVAGDLHLRFIHHPDAAPDAEDEHDYAKYWAAHAARTAGGIRSVGRVEGNVALLQIGPFLGLPRYAGTWQAAAMHLCHGAAGVVLDLRECFGGTPESAALICSYLLGPEPTHLTDVVSREGTQQFWTQPLLPGPRLGAELPVAVAVSSKTFSGGEELAFNLQELGRARVFGEQTRGGAHPRIGIRVHPKVELALPVAVPRSPRTGRNWEGTGVTPDVPAPASEAVQVAVAELRSRTEKK